MSSGAAPLRSIGVVLSVAGHYVDRNLTDADVVLPRVVSTEDQVSAAREDDANLALRPAPVTAISGGERSRGGRGRQCRRHGVPFELSVTSPTTTHDPPSFPLPLVANITRAREETKTLAQSR